MAWAAVGAAGAGSASAAADAPVLRLSTIVGRN
jgi:hypothetical protein